MSDMIRVVDLWVGRLTLAIGAGKFRETVSSMLLEVSLEAYERGKKDAEQEGEQ